MTKYGALINGSMSTAQKINIANALGIHYVRASLNIGNWVYTPTAYNQYITAGFGVVTNFNWLPSGGTPQPFRTSAQLADYGARMTAMLNAITLPELVIIENEEINPNYHSGPMSDYVGMLQTASPIVHAKGLKLADGGIYGTGLNILTFRYRKVIYGQIDADAFGNLTMTTAQHNAANNPGSNLTLEALATKVQAVLDASAYLDYINIHPYEVIDPSVVDPAPVTTITPGVVAAYQEFILAETGLPTITNETGQRDNVQPVLVTNILTNFDGLNFPYVLWFDGVGADGAQPLNDQTFPYALMANGEAFRDFLVTPTEGSNVVIDTPDTTIYLPDNSLAVTATVTPGYLHSITAILWTKTAGPATYTISSPATANTTFSNLVQGVYVFRITVTQDDAQTAYQEIEIAVAATATGIKYIMRWRNRQKDDYRAEITPKNYSGVDRYIDGADNPFTLKYQSGDGNIFSPLRASEAVIQFFTYGNISLTDFYNDDDTFWKVLFYGEKINDQAADDILLWTGFLQIDNSGEDLQDRPHIISLNANDNLGLLKNIALPTPTATQIYEGILLTELFKIILQQTSLLLSTRAYLNVFENAAQDRQDVSTADFLQQTIVYTNNLQNSDGTYKNCYDILSEILNTFRAGLCQCLGAWCIVRQGEFRLFIDAAVPGTLYDSDMAVDSAITLDPEITIGRGLDIFPINENQIKRVLRPFQFVKKTFNFSQPASLITQADLSLPVGATPYATSTVSGIRYDKYALATYFTHWLQRNGDTSYLEVATDVATNNEVERYIVTPCPSPDLFRGVQFNNIPISKDDVVDFRLQMRTFTDAGSNFRFSVRILLVTPNGTYYKMLAKAGDPSPEPRNVLWLGTFPVAGWDTGTADVSITVVASTNSSEYTEWSLSSFLPAGAQLPLAPEDGVLLIQVQGNNSLSGAEPHIDTLWKSITLTLQNAVNDANNVTGQVHTQTQPTLAKNNSDTDLQFDDSPRNSINGTLFRTPLVDFQADINEIYFFRTNQWHRAAIDEAWRLNQIQTFDELFIQRILRTIVEGDFKGLRYYTGSEWKYLSMQNIIKINFLQTLNFIFGIVEFNYMTAEFNATLYECFDDGEVDADLDNTYDFRYLYQNK